jgi:hypothetical protein
MRRENELIRTLMLHLETTDRVVNSKHSVDGYTSDQVSYHLAQIVDSGLAVGAVQYSVGNPDPTIPIAVMVKRLTPSGHDFIESIRNDTVWKKVKSKSAEVGGDISIGLLKELGTLFTRQLLGLSD